MASRVTGLGQLPGWAARSSPGNTAELDPAQKIKKKQRKIWAESQAQLAQSLLFYSFLF
jgi:hypothetical protein